MKNDIKTDEVPYLCVKINIFFFFLGLVGFARLCAGDHYEVNASLCSPDISQIVISLS